MATPTLDHTLLQPRPLVQKPLSPTTTVDKLYFLHQSLKGEPYHLVKHLTLNEDSFEVAWAILQKNYDIRRHMVNSQFELFFGLFKLQRGSAEELRNMLRICLECESAFKALALDEATLGLMMVYNGSIQMDAESARQWAFEQKNNDREAKLDEFVEFLQTRCRLLSQCEKNSKPSQPSTSSKSGHKSEHKSQKQAKSFLAQADKSNPYPCNVCAEDHRSYQCPTLLNATVEERRKIVVDKRLCFNCLFKHKVEECRSKYSCATCKKRHNALLHVDKQNAEAATTTSAVTFSGHAKTGKLTLLATACVPIYHSNRNKTIIRALIDQGSTANFVSEKVCQLINARRCPADTIVTSINNSQTCTIRSCVQLTIGSMYDKNYQLTFDALVLPKITHVQSFARANAAEWQHVYGFHLADPKYLEAGD